MSDLFGETCLYRFILNPTDTVRNEACPLAKVLLQLLEGHGCNLQNKQALSDRLHTVSGKPCCQWMPSVHGTETLA